ncbi:MAG: hypothetical protein U0326_19500 [Polyangiales bacterium]
MPVRDGRWQRVGARGLAMHNNGSVIAGIIGGLIVYALFLGAIIYFSLRWSRRILERKAEALAAGLVAAGARFVEHGEPKGLYRGREAAYDLAGRRVFVNAYYVSRSWVRLNFRVEGGPFPWVTLHPEGAFQKLGKSLGISREVQLGDQAFDDSVYIDTVEKSDERVRDVLASEGVRAALRELLGMGFRVQLSSRGVEAYRVEYTMTSVGEVGAARAVELIARIADEAPRFDAASLSPEPIVWNRFIIAAVVGTVFAGAGIGALAASAGQHTLDGGDVGKAILLGASLWVAFVVALVITVRGTSRAFSVLVTGAFVGLMVLPVAGGMVLLALNQALDQTPVETHDVTVLRMHRKELDLHVLSWRPGHTEERLHATGAFWRSIQAGDRVRVRVHAGRFGWPWVDRVSERADATPQP